MGDCLLGDAGGDLQLAVFKAVELVDPLGVGISVAQSSLKSQKYFKNGRELKTGEVSHLTKFVVLATIGLSSIVNRSSR